MLEQNPRMFQCNMTSGATRRIETDTPEETRKLFSAMQAAIFKYRNKSDHISFSIPLTRIDSMERADMMDVSGA